ncbi:MAG: XRE family transcriptional regulator [Hamadaea sp.]|nr:XRE family transcriptional regulator [Hamadaea sp.]
MSDRSPFGIRLWRLLARRRPSPLLPTGQVTAAFARDCGVPAAELAALVQGTEPSPATLRALGPALGIPAADMFVIASLPVPDDLASAWRTSPWDVGTIIELAAGMPAARIARLNELIRSLPEQPRTQPPPTDTYPEGPGALLLRLLMNRNIRPYNAKILYAVGGGPYVSDATVGQLGPGRVVLTAQYVTAFAHLLGYAPEDMVAITGVGPVLTEQAVHPAAAEIAAVAWNARRLTSDQIADVRERSRKRR